MSDEDGRSYERDGRLIVPWRFDRDNFFALSPEKIAELGTSVIHLLTPEEFAQLPDGTTVIIINGEIKVKGRDYVDQETRSGRLAYGLRPEDDK